MNELSKNSNFSTLILTVLKDIRNERGVHQGYMAQMVGKSPSAWSKIEGGQSPLTTDVMLGACWALQLQPSYVMTVVERIVPMLNGHGFYFHVSDLADEEDALKPLVNAYFASKGFEAIKSRPYDRVSVTAVGNMFIPDAIPTVVRYCCEPAFRDWFDNGAEPTLLNNLNGATF